MNDLSPRSVRALCTRAARGAGYDWDLAEEAGYAAERLEQVNWPGAYLVSVLLEQVADPGPSAFRPDPGREGWCVPGGAVCPITLGAFLSRNGWVFARTGRLTVSQLLVPALLLPFLSGLTHGRSNGSGISWAGTRLLEYSGRLEVVGDGALARSAGPALVAPLIGRPNHAATADFTKLGGPTTALEVFARQS